MLLTLGPMNTGAKRNVLASWPGLRHQVLDQDPVALGASPRRTSLMRIRVSAQKDAVGRSSEVFGSERFETEWGGGKNQNGEVIEVKSTTQGARLKLAAEGIKLNVVK